MASTRDMPVAVRRYLEELEGVLKRQIGVVPEEALSDAREFLISTSEALDRSGENLSADELYMHFTDSFGMPADVAAEYASAQPPAGMPLLRPTVVQPRGYAPGWRICCTRCGRSAPLAAVGGVRIAARSIHKYTLGWCRGCRWIRWLRIIRDLDAPNLTERMGITKTPDESLKSLHRPVLTVVGILLGTLLLMLAILAVAAAVARGQDGKVMDASASRAHGQRFRPAPAYATSSLTTFPNTSVNRNGRPWN